MRLCKQRLPTNSSTVHLQPTPQVFQNWLAILHPSSIIPLEPSKLPLHWPPSTWPKPQPLEYPPSEPIPWHLSVSHQPCYSSIPLDRTSMPASCKGLLPRDTATLHSSKSLQHPSTALKRGNRSDSHLLGGMNRSETNRRGPRRLGSEGCSEGLGSNWVIWETDW